jgi:phosphopantothenoylcysteine synthetase/decarboxylase
LDIRVGAVFALETDNEVENAVGKIKSKNLDMIVLNSIQNLVVMVLSTIPTKSKHQKRWAQ